MAAKINSLTIGTISGGTFIFGNIGQVCPVTSTEPPSQTSSESNSISVSGSQNTSSTTTPTPSSGSGNTL
ncbi:hypothetical protein C3744_05160 [Priestia megaterium]|uniref:Uncharacterized protein n=1 Tax=Priestia megaterium TaxID=1404 RepID=A0A3D8X9L3_PRIMG|nr:hypothetical protein [Priestia megaterium]MDH3170045.1 hypothetical protein [Priestia megaterium]RDZ18261.1 hypothetical protein C3744_05160 [Priestia megaterium]